MMFVHNGALGDIIYSLPSVMTLGGGDFCFTKKGQYDNGHTLIESQDFIGKVIHQMSYREECITLDFYRSVELRYRTSGNIRHLAEYFLIGLGIS